LQPGQNQLKTLVAKGNKEKLNQNYIPLSLIKKEIGIVDGLNCTQIMVDREWESRLNK